jgi:hypothetical protein
MVIKKPTGRGNYIYNGVDRVNNSLGYTKDNCKPCCKMCNKMKGTMSLEEFKSFIINAYNNLIKKEDNYIVKS